MTHDHDDNEDFSVEDDIARLHAQIDQVLEDVKGLARATGVYHAGLIEQGLGPQQALHLTSVWLAAAMHNNGGDDDDD